jgi:phosphoglycerate dehydrogenase-like enzyme
MANPKTIIVTIKDMISDPDLTSLKKVSDVTYVERESVSQDELSKMVKGYDYLMLNYDVVKKLDGTFYSNTNAKNLKGISVDMTGMEWANPAVAKENKITLMNVPDYCTESVSESIILEVLLHSRKIHEAYLDVIKGSDPKDRKGINLKGRTAGVVGLGAIGSRTAELLNGLGMNVIAWNRTPKQLPGVKLISSIKELFSLSDVVCLCLKLVESGPSPTFKIIGADILKSSKAGLILVNLGSKDLVDHDAIYDPIKAGKIVGYSVTRGSSTKSLKIEEFDCVHMPPANAWFSDESLAELRRKWAGNIVAAIKGKPENIFDGETGTKIVRIKP